MTLIRKLRDIWYLLKCRFWHRYNVVRCALPPTWHDRDRLLLYAAFQLFEDFITKEKPWEFTGDVYAQYLACGDEDARRCDQDWQRIRLLYDWWQVRKNADDDDDEDNRMLHKLIDLREYLWT